MPYHAFLAVALLSVLLLGCNCLSGLGQDMQQAGETLEEEAEEHHSY